MFLASNGGGWLGDYFIHSCGFRVASARKTVNTIGFVGAAGALVLMPAAQGPKQGIAATTCTLTMAGLARGGFSVNHMDIAPRHAGVVMGVSNTAGTLAGVVGVAVTGVLLQHAGSGSSLAGCCRNKLEHQSKFTVEMARSNFGLLTLVSGEWLPARLKQSPQRT
ncbi:hypothetical protein WJX84_007770 [Apatococcus fuscideae]|uniref:Uncharacterized protein n=1 Tax=Apatococcus fuscideae TaxID=2026836 RepID=A0AAW1SQP9_9CHLO